LRFGVQRLPSPQRLNEPDAAGADYVCSECTRSPVAINFASFVPTLLGDNGVGFVPNAIQKKPLSIAMNASRGSLGFESNSLSTIVTSGKGGATSL
jgi:hypothetical protein